MKDDLDIKLGDLIRSLRLAKGYSTREFARRINKTHSTVIKYEKGDVTIGISALRAMCNALDVDFIEVCKKMLP